MTPQDATQLAAHILQRGKTLTPDRFPKPSPTTTQAWGQILAKQPFPLDVWPEAVDYWAANLVADRMATPHDLIQAARAVMARWETQPEHREALKAHRQALETTRDQQIRDGTFAKIRGITRRTIEHTPPALPPSQILKKIKETQKHTQGPF